MKDHKVHIFIYMKCLDEPVRRQSSGGLQLEANLREIVL
jgi:hypothetical protein